jgi:peptidoglycan hydrolase CwlO-like protein
MGWVLLLLVVGAVILIYFFRRRVPAAGDPEAEEAEELEMFYQRCQKNLDNLAETYVDAQSWLERLEGKIPRAQWKDWNDKFTRVRIDDFTKQLKEIRQELDQGRHVTARAALFSFDEDAVAVFEFFREMENTLEDVG